MTTVLHARAGRILLFIITIVTLVWALGVLVFGTVDLISQLAQHTLRPTMYYDYDFYSFVDTGDGLSRIRIAGEGGAVVTAITGVSVWPTVLYAASVIVRLLIQLALGALALGLLERLRSGRPFGDAAWRRVAALSITVLAFGIASQLIAWWARLAILAEAHGQHFSTAFVFEPLTVTVGLALVLVAVAFRVGERLQRETEGLI